MSFEEMVRPGADTEAAAAAVAPRRGLELRRPPRSIAGGMPQVSLLPPEMRDAERVRGVRRGLIAAVVVVALVTAAGVAGATAIDGAAQASMLAATQRSQDLGLQIVKFAGVQKLQKGIAEGDAAVQVGSATQIDWQKQVNAIEADMPEGFVVTTITADGANATADYAQGASPLDKPRAATVLITVTAPNIDQLPIWLRKLRSVPSYADATPVVSGGTEDAGYNVLITLHLNAKAFEATTTKGTAP